MSPVYYSGLSIIVINTKLLNSTQGRVVCDDFRSTRRIFLRLTQSIDLRLACQSGWLDVRLMRNGRWLCNRVAAFVCYAVLSTIVVLCCFWPLWTRSKVTQIQLCNKRANWSSLVFTTVRKILALGSRRPFLTATNFLGGLFLCVTFNLCGGLLVTFAACHVDTSLFDWLVVSGTDSANSCDWTN
jgi:hypothetical protein